MIEFLITLLFLLLFFQKLRPFFFKIFEKGAVIIKWFCRKIFQLLKFVVIVVFWICFGVVQLLSYLMNQLKDHIYCITF